MSAAAPLSRVASPFTMNSTFASCAFRSGFTFSAPFSAVPFTVTTPVGSMLVASRMPSMMLWLFARPISTWLAITVPAANRFAVLTAPLSSVPTITR